MSQLLSVLQIPAALLQHRKKMNERCARLGIYEFECYIIEGSANC